LEEHKKIAGNEEVTNFNICKSTLKDKLEAEHVSVNTHMEVACGINDPYQMTLSSNPVFFCAALFGTDAIDYRTSLAASKNTYSNKEHCVTCVKNAWEFAKPHEVWLCDSDESEAAVRYCEENDGPLQINQPSSDLKGNVNWVSLSMPDPPCQGCGHQNLAEECPHSDRVNDIFSANDAENEKTFSSFCFKDAEQALDIKLSKYTWLMKTYCPSVYSYPYDDKVSQFEFKPDADKEAVFAIAVTVRSPTRSQFPAALPPLDLAEVKSRHADIVQNQSSTLYLHNTDVFLQSSWRFCYDFKSLNSVTAPTGSTLFELSPPQQGNCTAKITKAGCNDASCEWDEPGGTCTKPPDTDTDTVPEPEPSEPEPEPEPASGGSQPDLTAGLIVQQILFIGLTGIYSFLVFMSLGSVQPPSKRGYAPLSQNSEIKGGDFPQDNKPRVPADWFQKK